MPRRVKKNVHSMFAARNGGTVDSYASLIKPIQALELTYLDFVAPQKTSAAKGVRAVAMR